MKKAYNDFARYAHRLEAHYKDMQDMEFTIEHGKLYFYKQEMESVQPMQL